MVQLFRLKFWTSLDQTVHNVHGNQETGYNLTLNGSSSTCYYLNIEFIELENSRPRLRNGIYPFYLAKLSTRFRALWSYWSAKGVKSTAAKGTWENEMWKIINGQEPIFYLRVNGGTPTLVDGLQKWQWDNGFRPIGGLTGPYNPLQVDGDYPTGSYTFTCNIGPLNGVAMKITFNTAVEATASNLFIIQHASGPEGNMDTAMTTLLSSMQSHGLNFFKTSAIQSGLIGANDVIVIKVNGQSNQRGGTNTDLVKSLVQTIVGHPDGFTGEIVIADNGEGGVDMLESNAYDHSQSMTDVAAMFPTYNVSAYSWNTITGNSVADYDSLDFQDGYVVDSTPDVVTGVNVTYPKFKTLYGTYISFLKGVCNIATLTYDSSRLKIINLPIFKSHYMYGATACVKNYMGVGSQYLTSHDPALMAEHNTVGDGGMGTMMVETRFPTLNILDGIWINANPFQQPGLPNSSDCGPFTTYAAASYTDVIGASIDPVALEYWFAKNVAIPAAVQRGYCYTSSMDPDYEIKTYGLDQSYHHYLTASMNQIKNSFRQATMLESEMNVYVTDLNTPNPALPFTDNFANLDVNVWNIIDGTWATTSPASGVLQGISNAFGEGLIWAGDTGWTNYRATANVQVVNSGEASLVVRYKGPNDFYWLGLGCWTHKYSISKVVGGATQELVFSELASDIEVGRWYLVSAVAVDGMLQLFVDGVKVLQYEDGDLSNGAIGFRNYGGINQGGINQGVTMQAKQLSVQSMVWNIKTIEPGSYGIVGQGTSIALDSNGNPHISYYDATNHCLKYIKRTGSTWSVPTPVDSSGDVGSSSSLALDSSGNPHISYSTLPTYGTPGGTIYGDLKYTKWTGTEWILPTVVDSIVVGGASSLALDSNGNPHISYLITTPSVQSVAQHLMYAEFNGSAWSKTAVCSSVYGLNSLALDSNGYPHISFAVRCPNYTWRLVYAESLGGSGWYFRMVDSLSVGWSSSLALDSSGNPHMSYCNNGALKYVHT